MGVTKMHYIKWIKLLNRLNECGKDIGGMTCTSTCGHANFKTTKTWCNCCPNYPLIFDKKTYNSNHHIILVVSSVQQQKWQDAS